ncbi:chorismate-binding protein [Robiginitomaculum antarcticum]|uniref:chorismate-binding protein n=1 Tax=Robiginitomaculum antarcticum TaxID=437507 RepID=UPI000366DD0F|nr:chorismate-binding protein [Robiginitomaculum antarcticum]
MTTAPYIFLEDQILGRSRYYCDPVEVIEAYVKTDIESALARVDSALTGGYYVAGFVAYEAGLMSEAINQPHPSDAATPLLQFGVFKAFNTQMRPNGDTYTPRPDLVPVWDEAAYLAKFVKAKAYIETGDIYQINLTFPFEGKSADRPDFPALYGQLRQRQPVQYGAVCALGETHILSLSPELFFEIDGKTVRARPMKGTAPRSSDPERDVQIAKDMQADAKSQAENLMIVDLLRNDLSTVGQSGTTKVTQLFTLETYPTLHQMTSSIETTLQDGVSATQVFARLFPCGSVTGAPKRRAMDIIAELEDSARGLYCGGIGYFDPSGNAKFNVAIRTLVSQPAKSGYVTRYGVGSGVVYDSVGALEYKECLLKSDIITGKPHLIETLKWSPQNGFMRLDRHIDRLLKSSKELGYTIDIKQLYIELESNLDKITTVQRIRISLAKDGYVAITTQDLDELPLPIKLVLSKTSLTATRQNFEHKTDARAFYNGERERLIESTACDEVLFLNSDGQLCEGSFTSLFIAVDGKDTLLTPTLSCGLLPGVLRESLIASGEAVETLISIDDLSHARQIFVGNSLRGLMPAVLIDNTPQ